MPQFYDLLRRAAGLVGWFLLAWLAPVSAQAQPQDEDCASQLEPISRQFRGDRLRVRDENAPHRAELRRWDGPLHRLMKRIERCVVQERLVRGEVIRLLGEPDAIAKAGERHTTVKVRPGEEHLIYWWRGGHDYLYFILRKDRVAESAWWFAGD